MIGIISVLLLVMWVFFFYSVKMEYTIFIAVAGMGLILFSVYIMANGLEGVDNFVTKGLAVIQIGIGLLGLYSPLYDLND